MPDAVFFYFLWYFVEVLDWVSFGDNPRVLKNLLGGQPLFWVLNENPGEEVFGLMRDIVPVRGWKAVIAISDHLEKFFIALAVEWWESAEHDV